jgi:glutaredoxin 2
MFVKEQSIFLEDKLDLVRFVDQLHVKTIEKVKIKISSAECTSRFV